jgi:cell division protein FtsQ
MVTPGQNKHREPLRLTLLRNKTGVPGKNSRTKTRLAPSYAVPWKGLAGLCLSIGLLCFLVLFIAGVSFGLLYSYRSLTTNSWFALKKLEIKGTSRVSSKEILDMTGLGQGANLLALPLDLVEKSVIRSPWVEGVSVKRVLPGTMIIDVREKTPEFWVLHPGALLYAEAWGKPIAPVRAGKFASLPALEVEKGAEEATGALPDLVRSLRESPLPPAMASVSWVRLSAARGVEVYMEDSRLKLTIGLEEWQPNLRRLGKTLADLQRRGELGEVREIKAQGANVWVEKAPAASARLDALLLGRHSGRADRSGVTRLHGDIQGTGAVLWQQRLTSS